MADQELSPARIMQIATGGWAASILATAAIHSIFTHVETGADTPESVSRRAGISLRGAGTLLDGLVGLGLMTVSGGRYRNAPDAAEFVVDGKIRIHGRIREGALRAVAGPHEASRGGAHRPGRGA
jgi:hypothetical protein